MPKAAAKAKNPKRSPAVAKQAVTKSTAKQATPNRSTKQKLPVAPIPSIWQLTKTTAFLLWDYRVVLTWVIIIFGLLNVILVQGLASGTDVSSLKDQLNKAFSGNVGALASSLGVLIVLVGSTGNHSSPAAAPYQFLLALMGSLAIIWTLRQVVAGNSIRAREAYYRGMYPLVPFVLILLFIGLELLPLLIGSSIYSAVMSGGIAVHIYEKVFWTAAFAAVVVGTLYMLTASLMALYIVTLPDMTPVKAIRSARDLVRGRRWTVMRKMLWLPLIMLLVAVVVMVPIIIFITPITQIIFFILTMLGLLGFHAYMYVLYREVLR